MNRSLLLLEPGPKGFLQPGSKQVQGPTPHVAWGYLAHSGSVKDRQLDAGISGRVLAHDSMKDGRN